MIGLMRLKELILIKPMVCVRVLFVLVLSWYNLMQKAMNFNDVAIFLLKE